MPTKSTMIMIFVPKNNARAAFRYYRDLYGAEEVGSSKLWTGVGYFRCIAMRIGGSDFLLTEQDNWRIEATNQGYVSLYREDTEVLIKDSKKHEFQVIEPLHYHNLRAGVQVATIRDKYNITWELSTKPATYGFLSRVERFRMYSLDEQFADRERLISLVNLHRVRFCDPPVELKAVDPSYAVGYLQEILRKQRADKLFDTIMIDLPTLDMQSAEYVSNFVETSRKALKKTGLVVGITPEIPDHAEVLKKRMSVMEANFKEEFGDQSFIIQKPMDMNKLQDLIKICVAKLYEMGKIKQD